MWNIKRKLNKLKKALNALIEISDGNTLNLNTAYYQSRMLAESRILLKKLNKLRLNIVLIVFEPATWLMFQSIYETFSKDERIYITVVAIPYAHSTLPAGTYKDDGMREYLDKLGIPYIYGYNKMTEEWIDLFDLHPDYVFYQAPYNAMYPNVLQSGNVSKFACICYVPYGTSLTKNSIQEIIFPKDFFSHTTLFFFETDIHKKMLLDFMRTKGLYLSEKNVIVSGSTILETLRSGFQTEKNKKYFTILWTPRWNTGEGYCTFFDYYSELVEYTEQNENIRLIFRPHPLLFQNFLSTGELSAEDVESIKRKFSTERLILDTQANYLTSFNMADILVADITSLLYDFFATGKPIIYTSKKDELNLFGIELSSAFYKVSNWDELVKTINFISAGDLPLKNITQDLINKYFKNIPSSQVILNELLS